LFGARKRSFFVKTNIRFYDLAAVRGLHSLTGSFEP
jgi:hypothetical protein